MSPLVSIRVSKIGTAVLIWFVGAVLISALTYGILGDLDHYPSTGNPYDPARDFAMNAMAATFVGAMIGLSEVFWLGDRFKASSFGRKIVAKSGLYLAIILVAVLAGALLTMAIRVGEPFWSPAALQALSNFVGSFAFLSILLFCGVVAVVTLFVLDISDTLGQGVLRNFLFGTYHVPRQEERVFMFLDMKSSTTIAERLGHVSYFSFLNDFFRDLTDPILASHGVIYQYVGDEVVVSWPAGEGLVETKCLGCFTACKNAIVGRGDYYRDVYGVAPDFRASLHLGAATVGEIGSLKKEIVFSGDALNTGARIQALCGTYGEDLLISGDLIDALAHAGGEVQPREIGEVSLRGRARPMRLFALGA